MSTRVWTARGSHRPVALLLATSLWWSAGAFTRAAESPPSSDYWAARERLDQAFAEKLAELADKCDELKLEAPAKLTRQWAGPRDPNRQHIFLPSEVDEHQPAADAPTVVQQWYKRFRKVRADHAAALFDLAQAELKAGQGGRAYQLLHEVLHENPDHEKVRQALGYRQLNGRWRKPEGSLHTRVPNVADPALGFNAGRYWITDSEHFNIKTSHSQQAGERLAASLEELYGVWQQVYFSYWSSAASLARRFERQPPVARNSSRHKVVLFRDKQQYVSQLSKLEPRIQVSVGFYAEAGKTAYFFGGDEATDDNCFHEVTHQLFSETGRVAPPVGTNSNFWAVEAAALYMESLRKWEHGWTVGGVDAKRLQYARYHVLCEKSALQLAKLAGMGRQTLQHHADIQTLYSQAAGQAAFLMDAHRGRYREPFVGLLQAVYQGRDRPETLPALTGVTFPRLDDEYREFLQVRDADLTCLADHPGARVLLLGQTQITDAALTSIRHCRNLELLDLRATRITDAGLAQLADLTSLKELWLSGTAVSDEGLIQLRNLKKLETFDAEGSRVTADGLKQLKAALPMLKEE